MARVKTETNVDHRNRALVDLIVYTDANLGHWTTEALQDEALQLLIDSKHLRQHTRPVGQAYEVHTPATLRRLLQILLRPSQKKLRGEGKKTVADFFAEGSEVFSQEFLSTIGFEEEDKDQQERERGDRKQRKETSIAGGEDKSFSRAPDATTTADDNTDLPTSSSTTTGAHRANRRERAELEFDQRGKKRRIGSAEVEAIGESSSKGGLSRSPKRPRVTEASDQRPDGESAFLPVSPVEASSATRLKPPGKRSRSTMEDGEPTSTADPRATKSARTQRLDVIDHLADTPKGTPKPAERFGEANAVVESTAIGRQSSELNGLPQATSEELQDTLMSTKASMSVNTPQQVASTATEQASPRHTLQSNASVSRAGEQDSASTHKVPSKAATNVPRADLGGPSRSKNRTSGFPELRDKPEIARDLEDFPWNELDSRMDGGAVVKALGYVDTLVQSAIVAFGSERNVDLNAASIFIDDPEPGLEKLYKAMLGTEDWRQRVLELADHAKPTNLAVFFIVKGLIFASLYRDVFSASMPWDFAAAFQEFASEKYKFAEFAEKAVSMRGYFFRKWTNHVTFMQAKDKGFQEAYLKPRAKELAGVLAMALMPHLKAQKREPSETPPVYSPRWLEELEEAFFEALKLKSTLDGAGDARFIFTTVPGRAEYVCKKMRDVKESGIPGQAICTLTPGVRLEVEDREDPIRLCLPKVFIDRPDLS